MTILEVKNLKVRSLDVDYNEISWEIESTTEDVLDYTFAVLRSQGPEGPYEAVSTPLEDQYLFIDNHVRTGDVYRNIYYKIRVTHKPSGDTKDTEAADRGAEPDLIATEIRKHMNLLFREFIGRRCWVFPIRTFGQRCSCWNNVLSKKTRSGCRTCFDTGYVKGYMRPIESWLSIDPNANNLQQTTVAELQQSTTTARLGYWPPLKPRDLIVEPENNRWRVVQVNQTEQLRAPVHQEIQIHQIPKTDVEYAMKFDIGDPLRNMFLSPARNFTNPQNLGNFLDEEIPGILSLYDTTYNKPPT